MNEIRQVIEVSIGNKSLTKIILSQPDDKKIIKSVARVVKIKGNTAIQLETFTSDNKAYHKNISLDEAAEVLTDEFEQKYTQLNIIDKNGEAQAKKTKGGKVLFKNKIKVVLPEADISEPDGQNREKNYILSKNEKYDFLVLLGIQDKNGRIYDKKQSKFKQINRFLEIISDEMSVFPAGKKICIWDLCCGKSYLTYAVYYYLKYMKKYDIIMYGADLKQDVIDYCTETAKALNYDDLHFICEDITKMQTEQQPDMVISLHACNTATDIVLAKAIKNNVKLIFSSPCCHHEMSEQIACRELDFIIKEPILKQRLCEVATDALRVKMLEANGYKVKTLEFVDTDNTPKNIMIKAVKIGYTVKKKALCEYNDICSYLNVSPYLKGLLDYEDDK